MTSPWGIIGLTYDSEDLQLADLSRFLAIQNGLNELPTVRGVDTIVPGRGGRSERNRKNDILQIVLVGQVTSDPTMTTRDDARASFRAGMRFFRTLFASNRDRADLVALLEDGGTATISARPMNIIIPKELGSEYASVSVELEGYDDWVIVDAS